MTAHGVKEKKDGYSHGRIYLLTSKPITDTNLFLRLNQDFNSMLNKLPHLPDSKTQEIPSHSSGKYLNTGFTSK